MPSAVKASFIFIIDDRKRLLLYQSTIKTTLSRDLSQNFHQFYQSTFTLTHSKLTLVNFLFLLFSYHSKSGIRIDFAFIFDRFFCLHFELCHTEHFILTSIWEKTYTNLATLMQQKPLHKVDMESHPKTKGSLSRMISVTFAVAALF